jgi:hypothetical protein
MDAPHSPGSLSRALRNRCSATIYYKEKVSNFHDASGALAVCEHQYTADPEPHGAPANLMDAHFLCAFLPGSPTGITNP